MQGGSLEPVAGPPPVDLRKAVANLEKRSYATYLNRLVAQERLAARNNAWNFALIAITTATTIASVGLLSDSEIYGSQGATLLAALAVVSLAASIAVSSMNYGARSRAMEANYKRLQQISIEAENFWVEGGSTSPDRFFALVREYGVAVENSENHTVGDFARVAQRQWQKMGPDLGESDDDAIRKRRERAKRLELALRPQRWRDTAITLTPYVSLLVPLGILVPFANWTLGG